MDVEHAAVGETVVEEGVGDQSVHAGFVGLVKGFAAVGGEGDGVAGLDEIAWRDHARVDGLEDGGFGDERAEGLHKIERESGAAETGLVVEADHGVETGGVAGDGEVFGQHAIGERQEGVDGIARRAAVAGLEIKRKAGCRLGGIFGFEHVIEFAEVQARAVAFNAQELFERGSFFGTNDHGLHLIEHKSGRLVVIAHEHSSVIADFAGDEFAGEAEAEPVFVGEFELGFAEEHVLS